MKNYAWISILCIMVIFNLNCSSTPKVISEKGIDKTTPPLENNTQDKVANLEFPISDDMREIGNYFNVMYGGICLGVKSYRYAANSYEPTLNQYVSSGYPLFWARNLLDGSIIGFSSGTSLEPGRQNASYILWQKIDDTHAKFSFVYPTGKINEVSNTEEWLGKTIDLQYGTDDAYLVQNFGYSNAKTIITPGGMKILSEISDSEVRWIYGQCGDLVQYVNSRTELYYRRNKILPMNFADLMIECDVAIKENFLRFAENLGKRDIEFKIGFDYDNYTLYSILKIDDEKYINYCYRYREPYTTPPETKANEGRFVGCVLEELDMSSPMISNDNISEFIVSLPNYALISANDIQTR